MTPEDLILMFNMGWSLQAIADFTNMPVKTVQEIIVAQVKTERLTARLFSLA
jgi:hypothetical protein